MTEHDGLAQRGRALEEEYFRKRDRELIDKMRQAAAAEQGRGELGRKTGLDDPALLKELQDLGFTPETVILLPVLPVLEMAWAEGEITPAERSLIVKFARSRGVDEHSAADGQMTEWMARRPDQAVFRGARRLIAAMLSSGSSPGGRLTIDDLVAYCEEIAAASGGLLGLRIGSISVEEKALLSRIASDLKARQA
jgi:DNA-binding phage protein